MPKKLKEINYDEMEAKPKKTKKAEIDYDKMEREETLAKAKKTAQREKIKAFLMKVIEKKKQKKAMAVPKEVPKPSPKPQPKIASVEDSSLDLAIQKARADFLKVKNKVKKGKTEKGYKHRTTATHDEEKELIKLIAKKYKLKKGSVVDEATRDEIEYLLTKEKSPSVKGKKYKGVPMSGNFVVSLTTNNLSFRPVEGI
jgi:hypothetical protein